MYQAKQIRIEPVPNFYANHQILLQRAGSTPTTRITPNMKGDKHMG